MYVELAILAVVVVFAIVFITISRLERIPIRDFVACDADTPRLDQPYFIAMNNAARQLGFVFAGEFRQDRTSSVYRARLALWVSPDGQLLLRIAGGKTAGVPIRKTMVTCFVEPDRIVETADDFGSADITGLTDREVLLNADLEELLARHLERMVKYAGPNRGFSPHAAFAAYLAIQAMRSMEMVRQGLGEFVDEEKSAWRHTLRGSWLNYTEGFRRQWTEGKAQAHRIEKKRPGDP